VQPFIGLFVLLMLRFISNLFVRSPVPEGMLWERPGFPSLFVTYGVTRDFFFSGHTATAVFAATQLYAVSPWLGLAGIAVAVFEIGALVVLRAHWTVDIIAGAAAALCVAAVAPQLAGPIDRLLASVAG
jgi:membrane-associated phospholipid phosphatase